MILGQDPNQLTQLLQGLGPDDRKAVLVVVGTVVAAVAGRLIIALLMALLKALALAAVVAGALWLGVHELGGTGTAEHVMAPAAQIPTIGPLAPTKPSTRTGPPLSCTCAAMLSPSRANRVPTASRTGTRLQAATPVTVPSSS